MEINEDKDAREWAESRLKFVMDYTSSEDKSWREGIERGRAEQKAMDEAEIANLKNEIAALKERIAELESKSKN